jgi:alpha-1,2-mannosyltransferase
MATTSSELGGLFADGKGHEIAQGYGMFLWAAVLIYAAVAWRLWARHGDQAAGLAASESGRAPHLAYRKAETGRFVAG